MKSNLLKLSKFVVAICISTSAFSQTSGTLEFNFTTIAHSGYQGTKNVLAAWIQTGTGSFVKTYFRYAGGNTNDHLPVWAVNSGGSANNCLSTSCNKVGATTGATLSGAVTKTFTWDGRDAAGNLVADGVYQVSLENCWNHGNTSKTLRTFSFTKGTSPDVQSPAADANFTGLTLAWNPSGAGVEENPTSNSVKIFPNPSGNGIFNVEFNKATEISVIDVDGKTIYFSEIQESETTKTINLAAFSNGIYFLNVVNGNNSSQQKIILEK